MNDLDKLTELQKSGISYHTSELSLLKREYKRKEEKEKVEVGWKIIKWCGRYVNSNLGKISHTGRRKRRN